MVISIVINTVNIAISPVLAFSLGMKFTGVAIGTLTAQWTGLIVGLVMCRKYALATPCRSKILNLSELKRYFTVNRDIFLRTLCLIAVTMWFTREGARQSDVMLAVNALLMQLFILFSYMIDGFAFAGEALTGRFVGSGNYRALKKCIRSLMKWGISLAVIYSLVYFVAGEGILSVLTDNYHVKEIARDYLPWAVTVPLCGFLAFIWDGIYIGATATRGMLLSMVGAMIVFFGSYFLLFPVMHNHGLWLAFLLYLLSRGLFQTLLFGRFFPAPGNVIKNHSHH